MRYPAFEKIEITRLVEQVHESISKIGRASSQNERPNVVLRAMANSVAATEKRRAAPSTTSLAKSGIALPSVLAMLLIATAVSSAILMAASTLYKSASLRSIEVRNKWALSAGLNRATAAITTPGDPMREALFDGEEVRWEFMGNPIFIRMENESEKSDINFASPDLVLNRLSIALNAAPAQLLFYATEQFQEARAKHEFLIKPEILLPIDARFGVAAQAIRRYFTSFSGQQSPAPHVQQSKGRLDSAPGNTEFGNATALLASHRRPIYRILAETRNTGSQPNYSSRSFQDIIIILSENDMHLFKIVSGHI